MVAGALFVLVGEIAGETQSGHGGFSVHLTTAPTLIFVALLAVYYFCYRRPRNRRLPKGFHRSLRTRSARPPEPRIAGKQRRSANTPSRTRTGDLLRESSAASATVTRRLAGLFEWLEALVRPPEIVGFCGTLMVVSAAEWGARPFRLLLVSSC